MSEGSTQTFIVNPFGSFRDFFLIMMGQRTFVARVGGRKNFSSEQTFPRLNQDVEKSQDWAEEIEASGPLAQARARTP